MNSFYEHHEHNIHWHYRCFDRILLNGLIQPFQQPERVVGFFNTYRQLYPVTRYTLRDIADQFQRWVKERAAKRSIPIVEAPKGVVTNSRPVFRTGTHGLVYGLPTDPQRRSNVAKRMPFLLGPHYRFSARHAIE